MEAQEPRAVSRRALMKISATAGVATAAAGLAGAASPATAAGRTSARAAGPTSTAADPTTADLTAANPATAAGPVVVHLVDARTGHVEVFTDGHRRQLTDHDLAARIARAARP